MYVPLCVLTIALLRSTPSEGRPSTCIADRPVLDRDMKTQVEQTMPNRKECATGVDYIPPSTFITPPL